MVWQKGRKPWVVEATKLLTKCAVDFRSLEFCGCSLDKSVSRQEVLLGNQEHIARVSYTHTHICCETAVKLSLFVHAHNVIHLFPPHTVIDQPLLG